MMLRSLHIIVCILLCSYGYAQGDTPSLVKSETGKTYIFDEGKIQITHLTRKQHNNWNEQSTLDSDINSPKSVSVSPDGTKYYINSLEGYKTVVYDQKTNNKLAVVTHKFSKKDSLLWAKPSGLYEFKGEYANPNTFSGKPVESCFSHGGRYVWIPYYRRSFDRNAVEPSALAVIDSRTDRIIKLMETGALPKMVASSPDGRFVAVSHWGENTVGIINIESNNPDDWHYVDCFTIDYKLKLDFDPNVTVNRDNGSGYSLRGTCFTPDSRYLLVGCMGGIGAIAVIDLQTMRYLGRVTGMMPNVRHLVIQDGWIYLSINNGGAVQRMRLDKFIGFLSSFNNRRVKSEGWQTCRVPKGARTISLTPDGRYIFAACNFSSTLAIVKTDSFKLIGEIPVDSYPVGLDISNDGKTVYVTSQGRNDKGGNAVNLFTVEYIH